MARALVGLGSNLGAREEILRQAIARLRQEPDVVLVATSGFFSTRPAGGPTGQPDYLNAAAVLETGLAPQALLERLLAIERELGRRRGERWGARPIDLDLLLFDREQLTTERLELPHPRMAWRRFVLEPAAEIAADWIHPPTGWSIARLLEHLNTTPRYVAVAGAIAAGKTELAGAVAGANRAEPIFESLSERRLRGFNADPAGTAWPTEIEFLRDRARLLDVADRRWSATGRWAVSDFWFDQSAAFAEVWLAADRQEEFRRLWREARRGVVRPRLIVLLEAPAAVLHERMLSRGRPYERTVRADALARIQDAIVAAAAWPDQGPVLRLRSGAREGMREEVLAAMEAME